MMIQEGKQINRTRVGVLGITFKEDVPDLRNTRVVDIIAELADYGIGVLVHDPLADPEEARTYYGVDLQTLDQLKGVDAVVVAVAHKPYIDMGLEKLARLCNGPRPVVVDVKSSFDPVTANNHDIAYWRL
jgi:UDP-N-acetyl-D-galactosamine dehydrogenase